MWHFCYIRIYTRIPQTARVPFIVKHQIISKAAKSHCTLVLFSLLIVFKQFFLIILFQFSYLPSFDLSLLSNRLNFVTKCIGVSELTQFNYWNLLNIFNIKFNIGFGGTRVFRLYGSKMFFMIFYRFRDILCNEKNFEYHFKC